MVIPKSEWFLMGLIMVHIEITDIAMGLIIGLIMIPSGNDEQVAIDNGPVESSSSHKNWWPFP